MRTGLPFLTAIGRSDTRRYQCSPGFEPVAIFDALTRQDGLDLPSIEEQRMEEQTEEGERVKDAMQPPPKILQDSTETLDRFGQQVDVKPSNALLVGLNPT
jgi:chloride channel protein, CIC family